MGDTTRFRVFKKAHEMNTALPQTSQSDAAAPATTTAVPATETAAHIIHTPFQHSEYITADPITNHDELTRAQSHGSAAARMSGDHFDRLLYGFDVENHLSPYGVAPTPNSLDTGTPPPPQPRERQTPFRDRQPR